MIGNDVIDLKLAGERNPLRPRFLNKVFTGDEQEIIFKDQNPVKQAWLLWAMKESAYKAHQRRLGLRRTFNPISQECSILFQTQTSVSGVVLIGTNNYKIRGKVNNNYIHSTATALPENLKSGWEIIPASEDLKKKLLATLCSSYGWNIKSVRIEKDKNSVPVVTVNNQPVPLAFSLSHHGEFAAFSFELMNY